MNKLVQIEFKKQRILTTEQLAEIYETDANNVRNNFGNHKDNFEEGKHYFLLQGDDLREFKRNVNNIDVVKPNVNQLYLWTERGANRHCKILDTDKAWEQFDNLEETYFRVKENAPVPKLSKEIQAIFILDEKQQKLEHEVKDLKDNMPLFFIDCEELQKVVRKIGVGVLGGKESPSYKNKSLRTKIYSDIQYQVKRQFGLNSYKAIKRSQLDIAINIINKYNPPFVLENEIKIANNQMSI